MIVAPLVFSTLVVGVAKVGDIKAVGRIGGKTMLWFLSASLLSLVLGMIMVNIFKPGEAMHLPLPPSNIDTGIHKVALSMKDFISHIVPKSMAEAMATNEILQIVVFSLFFGVATAAIGEKGQVIIHFFDAVAHVILKQGLSVLSTYALFIGEFYSTMLLLWVVLILIGFSILKGRVFNLMNRMKEPVLVAFSTASSEAAYPKTMQQLERFGCKDKIVSFVLPLGYSFNLDGSMLYMTFASLFIAQSYGIHLSFEQQITMLLILMLTSKGIAGVPRASLVVIAGTIATFNIPEAGLALLIGIDPLLDMGRSATNVIGNSLATAVLRTNDIIYLHNKANELGLWNFPDVIANRGADLNSSKVLRYEIEFNYQRKKKKVILMSDYNEIPKLRDVSTQMKNLVAQSINEAEERYTPKH
eukprot:gene18692-22266_t